MVVRLLVSIVDDDESVRESLPDLIREFGFSVRAFSSAEEFLASDSIGETKCLILDIAMPGMSGPDLQQELKLRGQAIPIVFITAHGDETVRPRMLAAGAVECLLKPFSDAALRKALDARPPNRLGDAPRCPLSVAMLQRSTRRVDLKRYQRTVDTRSPLHSGAPLRTMHCRSGSSTSPSSVNAPDQESRSAIMPQATPIVFVVDDDVSVRESLD